MSIQQQRHQRVGPQVLVPVYLSPNDNNKFDDIDILSCIGCRTANEMRSRRNTASTTATTTEDDDLVLYLPEEANDTTYFKTLFHQYGNIVVKKTSDTRTGKKRVFKCSAHQECPFTFTIFRNSNENRWYFFARGTGNNTHTCRANQSFCSPPAQINPQQQQPQHQHQNLVQTQQQQQQQQQLQPQPQNEYVRQQQQQQHPQSAQCQHPHQLQNLLSAGVAPSYGATATTTATREEEVPDFAELSDELSQMSVEENDTNSLFGWRVPRPSDSLQRNCLDCGETYHGWRMRHAFIQKCWKCAGFPEFDQYLGRPNMNGLEVLRGIRSASLSVIREGEGNRSSREDHHLD